VLRQIGKGGFGAIYLVLDTAIQEEIIFKILNPQLSMDETALARFVQELKLSRGITHKNVIRLFDFLDLGGARAVSMEYFPSRDRERSSAVKARSLPRAGSGSSLRCARPSWPPTRSGWCIGM
jgi:serine/threonine protein kinase